MPSRKLQILARADVPRVRNVDVDDALDPRRPRAHDDHPIGQLHGFIDVVGHEDDRLALRFPDAQQLAAHDQPGDGIERAERLVEEQHVGIDGQRARDFHALLHAARELLRIRLLESLKTDQLDVVGDAPLAFSRRQLEQAEPDVSFDGEPGKHAALLKDEDAARVGAVHRLAVDADLARWSARETRHHVQHRRLAAARWTQQADELAFADFEIDVVEHGDAAPSRSNIMLMPSARSLAFSASGR